MEIPTGKKIYFASDFHLGVPTAEESLKREKHIISWLNHIQEDACEIYLVGDIFDFWFEYRHAIPKGFVRLQGKIAELTDQGIPVYFFTGNHDMWMFDYFEQELGVKIFREPVFRVFNNQKFLIGHGDGLGPGDRGYKFIKKVFAANWSQWLFARMHPNFGIGLANYFSRKSRIATGDTDSKFLGEDQEWLVQYCKEQEQIHPQDYYIFGHRHLPMTIRINDHATYINLGEWIHYNTYAVFDGVETKLLEWNL
ncbi:UDP-2,3-diacylglucosamine diphosphatase [Fluviicola sp.]|uniref:UDP-2,3-diacylglucosamine diphosphatase n=1 Tax=Fluviicola sp. TaxID=1917219 RepID=UPI0031D87A0C